MILLIIGWCLIGQLSLRAQDVEEVLTMTEQINKYEESVSLEESLRFLENKYDVTLIYESRLVKDKVVPKRIIEAKNFQTALIEIAELLNLEYQQVGNRSFFLSTQEDFHQKAIVQETITGTVTDAQSGETLPGVNVMVKGTTTGTSTDGEGIFELTVESLQDTLIFSFVGYQTQEVAISGRTEIDVVLQSQAIAGEELVVVGYGTQQRSDLTGSVSSISTEEFNATQVNSVDQGLAGKAAGVQVTTTSGQPGAAASIKIRGSNSLQAGNQPLYVIDGLPIHPGSGAGPGNRLSALSSLNPQDIESIEILKDASSTSIYGSRGSNGVVLITTKSGRSGRDQVSLSATYGLSDIAKKIDVMEAYEYAVLTNEAYINDGMEPYYSNSEMDRIQSEGGTDWQDAVYRTAITQKYNLNFSGGDEKTVYSITGNYSNEEGIITNSSFERLNSRLNLTRNITDDFRIRTNITVDKTFSALSETGGSGTGSITYAALRMNPTQSIYQDKNAKPPVYTLRNAPGILIANPVASAKELADDFESTRLLGNMFAEYNITPNLIIKSEIGVDISNNKYDQFIPDYINQGQSGNWAQINNQKENMWINENTINYSTTINESHSLDVLAGITFQQTVWEGSTASSEEFVNNILGYNSLESATVYNSPASGYTEWSLTSYLGRLRYNYNDRYLLTVTGRVDGSSRFGENHKYGFFPAAAAAWRLSNEDFIDDLDIFSDLKLRLSYGITGNQEFNLYQALATLNSASYNIGRSQVTGFYPEKIPNPDLKWEKTNELDIGIDMSFFQNRLRITSDYYYKETNDLIYSTPIPRASGFNTTLQNVGSIQNQGLELAISSDNITNRDFNWSSSFNISFSKNKVLDLGGEEFKNVGAGDGHLKIDSPHRLQVGEPISVFYGYVFDGLFKTGEELAEGPNGPTNWLGGRKYKDISGPNGEPDGQIDANYDRTIIGNPHPDFYGGFRNTFSYKGFQLDAFLQFNYGNDIMNYNLMDMELPTGGQNVLEEMKNHWSEDNSDENVYPKPTTNRSQIFSSRQIEDGSYLKLRNLTLGYNFPNLVNSSQAIGNLRLYLSMVNYFTFTSYSGYDPDISYRGINNLQVGEDYNQYPRTKMIQIGLEIGF